MKAKLATLFVCLTLTACSEPIWNRSEPERIPPVPMWTSSGSEVGSASSSGETAEKNEVWRTLAEEAFSIKDVGKCSDAGNSSWSCVGEYWRLDATYGFNPRSCSKISDRESASSCRTLADSYVENYATEPSQCRKITNPEGRTRCSDRISMATAARGDVSSCEELRTLDMKQTCSDGHYLRMAESGTGWRLLCRKVSNVSVRQACERARFETVRN